MTLKQYIGAGLLILGCGFIAYFAVRSHLSPKPPELVSGETISFYKIGPHESAVTNPEAPKGLWSAAGSSNSSACPFWQEINKLTSGDYAVLYVAPGDYTGCPEVEISHSGPHKIEIRIKNTIPTCESLEDSECWRKR